MEQFDARPPLPFGHRVAGLLVEGVAHFVAFSECERPVSLPEAFEQGPSLGEFGGRLTVRVIKVVMDGALGSRGAALLEPYADDPDTRGLITTDTAALRTMLADALRNGIQVETHAIGDRGNRLTLDFYQSAFAAVPAAQRKIPEPRWRDEHSQIVHPDDLPRFKELGVTADDLPEATTIEQTTRGVMAPELAPPPAT